MLVKLNNCETATEKTKEFEEKSKNLYNGKIVRNLAIDNATCNVEKKNFNKDLEKCEKSCGSCGSDRERLREECATHKEENAKCAARYESLLIETTEPNEKEQQIFKLKLEECEN